MGHTGVSDVTRRIKGARGRLTCVLNKAILAFSHQLSTFASTFRLTTQKLVGHKYKAVSLPVCCRIVVCGCYHLDNRLVNKPTVDNVQDGLGIQYVRNCASKLHFGRMT